MANQVYFPEIKKNFGFGLMRLPMNGKEVDTDQVCRMVDLFLESGFNYFDTAHPYIDGKSEKAVKTCLSSRHPRKSYVLTDKLTAPYFHKEADIRPFFESQLEACGVTYFDFYLMHALSMQNFEHFKKCRAFETALELKKEGKIHHLGISFHDSPKVLDQILTEYPQIEIVQIQFNYADYEDPFVESRAVYEMARKHGKPIIVMEPVKGGKIVDLPDDVQRVFDELPERGSNASYAIRFAAGFDGMQTVLSGMSSIEQMEDNLSFMKDFRPLDQKEQDAVKKAAEIFRSKRLIPCTGCRYCIEENHCPEKIVIPRLFDCLNKKTVFHDQWQNEMYKDITEHSGKASDCIRCGGCEKVCPQHLKIRDLLKDVAEAFETA